MKERKSTYHDMPIVVNEGIPNNTIMIVPYPKENETREEWIKRCVIITNIAIEKGFKPPK